MSTTTEYAPGLPVPENRIEVPKPLDAATVQSFVENGFLAVEGLVTMEEVEEMRRDTVTIAKGGYPCESIQPLPPDTSDTEALQSVLCIHQPHYISPIMRKYATHPKICGVLSQITAAHLPFWDGSVKCMQSMLFVKPPTFQGQAWHQDEIYIPTRDRSLIGAWIALDDATVENGCLWVIPGSHRSGYLYPQKSHENPDEFDFAPESYGFDVSAQVPVEVKAGTVVFFNGYLLHRSFKNRSEIYRRVLVSHYMNAWSLLPWQIK
jgi:phytanoyl-CoA hydroxylase